MEKRVVGFLCNESAQLDALIGPDGTLKEFPNVKIVKVAGNSDGRGRVGKDPKSPPQGGPPYGRHIAASYMAVICWASIWRRTTQVHLQ